jgi:hypothetical protein
MVAFALHFASKLRTWGDDLMRKDDLMKSDLLSEVVLLASGVVLFLPLLGIIVFEIALK